MGSEMCIRDSLWLISFGSSDQPRTEGRVGPLPASLGAPNGLALREVPRGHPTEELNGLYMIDEAFNIWRINEHDPSDTSGVYGNIGAVPLDARTAPALVIEGLAMDFDENGDLYVCSRFTTDNINYFVPLSIVDIGNTSNVEGKYGHAEMPEEFGEPIGCLLYTSPSPRDS